MFQINDYIIYGGNGVCKVIDIGIPPISGMDSKRQYYILQPVYNKTSTIYTPIDNDKVIMRKVLSKKEAKELIETIPDIDTLEDTGSAKFQENNYKNSMMKYDCHEWVKIIKTLYIKKKDREADGKKITSTDEKYLQIAKDSLFGELAIPLEMDREETEELVAKYFH